MPQTSGDLHRKGHGQGLFVFSRDWFGNGGSEPGWGLGFSTMVSVRGGRGCPAASGVLSRGVVVPCGHPPGGNSMRTRTGCLLAIVLLASTLTQLVVAAPCSLELGTRGTFHEVAGAPDRCLIFEDVLGNTYEVANPKGAYRDGLSGVAWAEFAGEGTCTPEPSIRICLFEADGAKRVNGILLFRNFIECPGYVVEAAGQDYRIYNCDDYGADLCDPSNLGRRVQAQLHTEAEISICIGQIKSFVLDYRFVD